MDFADCFALLRRRPSLPFIVAGDHAVAAHGHLRKTHEVEVLIPLTDESLWKERFNREGFGATCATAFFLRFESGVGSIAIELMLVGESTFLSLWERAEIRKIGPMEARVPCFSHLIAFKLHLLKHSYRATIQAADIEMLIRRHGLNLQSQEYEQLFLKYGTREIYDTFCRVTRPERGTSMVPGP
jgi:hypothetical protein